MQRFCQYPDCKDFTLSPEENVKLVIRRHWVNDYFILAQWVFWGPLFFVLSIIGFQYFDVKFDSDTSLFVFSGKFLYLIFVTFHYYVKWLNDTFDVIFLTDDRVLDITQVGFWHRNIIETRLDHVQDATGDIKGFFNTLFNWGEIKIRTANDKADFSINMIDNAHQKAREIFRLANIARKKEIKGISKITEGDFCPVDFSGYKKENKTSRNTSETSEISEEKILDAHENYTNIKKDMRESLNRIMKKK